MTRAAKAGHRPGATIRQPGSGLQGLVGAPWMANAAGRRRNSEGQLFYDPDVFFPTTGFGYTTPKAICRSCPVTIQCLQWAMDNETGNTAWARHGVYGGLTPDERAALAKETA